MPHRLLLLLFCSCIFFELSAQMFFDQGRQISGTDSVQFGNSNALIVNPAYLGHVGDQLIDLRILQFGFNAHSDALDRYYVNRLSFSGEDISEDEKEEILSFAPERLDFASRASMEWLGFSLNTPSLGGLSVSISEDANGTMYLDEALTELFLEGLEAEWLQGQEDSIVVLPASVDGSKMYYQHLRTLQLGYGRTIISLDGFELFGGLNLARVWGMGHLDVSFRENVFNGKSSFSRFYDINYGDLKEFGEDLKTKVLSSAASGWKTSFGLSLNMSRRWNIGVALLDVGELEWTYRTSSAERDAIDIASDIANGVDSYKFEVEADYLYDVFGFEPSGSYSTSFDTRWRFNVLGRLSNDLSVSADLVIPTKDERYSSKTSLIMAVNYAPSFYGIAGIYINAGALYHEAFGWRMPFGLAGQLFGNAQVSVSTNDLITLVQNKTNPLSSLSVATLGLQF